MSYIDDCIRYGSLAQAFREAAEIAARGDIHEFPCPILPKHEICNHNTEEEIRALLEAIFLKKAEEATRVLDTQKDP